MAFSNFVDSLRRFLSKKGTSKSTKEDGDRKMNEQEEKPRDVLDDYLKAEFTAMDKSGDGMLPVDDFIKLIRFLGYGGQGKAQHLVKTVNKDRNAYITIDLYYEAIKSNQEVLDGTSMLRKMFESFDKTRDGFAEKQDIINGFKSMDIELDDDMKKEIEKMDTNKDGKVAYVDFLRMQLMKRGFLEKA